METGFFNLYPINVHNSSDIIGKCHWSFRHTKLFDLKRRDSGAIYGHLIVHLFDLFESISSRDAAGFQKGRSKLNLRLKHGKWRQKNGSGSRIRTYDQVVNSHLLYR